MNNLNNWTNHKVKQRIYIKEYIDLETGEILLPAVRIGATRLLRNTGVDRKRAVSVQSDRAEALLVRHELSLPSLSQ